MTKERASANNGTRPIKPVDKWENSAVHGNALCYEQFYREFIERTQTLRDRQAAYRASLPTDPQDKIRAAREILQHGGEDYPDGIEEALHLSYALEAMLKQSDLDVEGRSRNAALYIADRLSMAMHRAVGQLDRMSHILSIER